VTATLQSKNAFVAGTDLPLPSAILVEEVGQRRVEGVRYLAARSSSEMVTVNGTSRSRRLIASSTFRSPG
jgi:hypothetical protein